MRALIKTGDGRYSTASGTWVAERVRFRDWWGDYCWAYELVWRGNLARDYTGAGRKIWVSSPYAGRVVCRTLADAQAIVGRYEREAVAA